MPRRSQPISELSGARIDKPVTNVVELATPDSTNSPNAPTISRRPKLPVEVSSANEMWGWSVARCGGALKSDC